MSWKSWFLSSGGFSKLTLPERSLTFNSNETHPYHFDGQNWTWIRVGYILAFTITPDNTLWLGNDYDGLVHYDSRQDKYLRDFSEIYPTALTIAPDGALWAGTNRGVSRYDGHTWKDLLKLPEGINVASIAALPDGDIWVGFSAGDYVFERESMVTGWGDMEDLEDRFPGVAHYDGKGWEYLTTQDGLVSNEIRAITIGPDGNLYFGSFDRGVSRYDGQQWFTYQTRDPLLSNYVSTLDLTSDGQIWLGHPHGATFYDGQTWTSFRQIGELKYPAVRSISIGPENTIWFGGDGGVARFDGDQWATFLNSALNKITRIQLLSQDTVIVVSLDGVYQFGGQSWQRFRGNLSDMLSILVLPNDERWFGGLRGAYFCQGYVCKQYTEKDGLGDLGVNDIQLAPDESIWFGTCSGLTHYDSATWDNFAIGGDSAESLCYWDLAIAPDGSVWAGTDAGLVHLDGQNWTLLTTKDGLSASKIHEVSIGPDGTLWVATEAGLSHYIPPK